MQVNKCISNGARLFQLFLFAAVITGALYGQTPFTWKNVNIQGMGYLSGMAAQRLPPYDIYVRADVGGLYRFDRNNNRWLPLLDAFGTDMVAQNVDSIGLDPNDPNSVYAGVESQQYRTGIVAEILASHDRGATWTTLNLAAFRLGVSSADVGNIGERIAIDPKRPGRLYYGTRFDGLWIKDPSAPWVKASGGLPSSSAAPGFDFVTCDAQTGRVYTGLSGSGVWASDDGGITWIQVLAGANPLRGAIASDGGLYVTFDVDASSSYGSVRRYANGVWTPITPPGVQDYFSGLAVDPTNPAVVAVALNHEMNIWRSADRGATWTKIPATSAGNAPPYYAIFSESTGCCNSSLLIDPALPKRLWVLAGFGVLKTDDVTIAAPTWNWRMENLEELVVETVKVPPVVTVPGTTEPGADLLSGVADMMGFRHASRDVVPSSTLPSFRWVAQANSIAYSAQHPEYSAFVGWDHPTYTVKTGFTSDNGKTWAPFGDQSPGVSGSVAMSASNPLNIVWAPVQADVRYSMDGGGTWRNAMLAGGGLLPRSWQVNNVWWPGQIVVPDMITGGKFYYYANGDFYVSIDNAATWIKTTTIQTAGPAVAYTVYSSIVPNPAKSGDLYMTFARNANQITPFQLLHSTNGGYTWNVVPTLTACNYMAFGKGNDAQTPYMYVHGRQRASDPDAVYKSEDSGATWTQLTDPNLNQFGSILAMEGDMRAKDLVYVGTSGRGILYGYGPKFGSGQGGSSSSASFVKADTATKGNWKSAYGADGYNVADDLASYPSYLSNTVITGNSLWDWNPTTSDPRQLQRPSNPAARVEAVWFSPTSFTIDVPISDALPHQVALYMADYDFVTRRQTIDVLDSNGNILNSQALTSSFNGGVYLVWTVTGHVKFRVTCTGGLNGVVSGIFFGAAAVTASGSTASFVKADTTTVGNWKSAYGVDGYNVADDLASYPSYLSNTVIAGNSLWDWNPTTSDPRQLQRPSNPAARVQAVWFSATALTIDVPISDALPHQVALYMADYDALMRRQVIDVLDTNGNVLNSQALTSNFNGGVYLVWNVTGHVKFRITCTGGLNGVISGIFFGAAAATASGPTASFVKADTATGGNWKSAYGADGYNVADDLASYPSYLSSTVIAGNSLWDWNPTTSDPRQLQRPSNPAARVEAVWFSPTSFTIDVPISDARAHQVALYMADYDVLMRRQVIDVLDTNGNVLNSQALTSNFSGGVYLVWNVTGHVKFRITCTGGLNGIVSGIFFGASTASGGPAASFVKADTTTGGNWKSVYGADGYNVADDLAFYPPYLSSTVIAGNSLWNWNPPTSDPRQLQKPSNPPARVEAVWFSPTSFTIDVPISDARAHQVALYMADYDALMRRQVIDVLDTNGNVLNSQALTSNFSGGVYLVWNVTGHVKFRITCTAGLNGIVSGIFFQ